MSDLPQMLTHLLQAKGAPNLNQAPETGSGTQMQHEAEVAALPDGFC